MPPDTRDQALLLDMLDSARAVVALAQEMTYQAFVGDRRSRHSHQTLRE
jgi:uncharacterized protein with HEPN domain